MEKFILALDQGTTSSRAILFNRQGQIHSIAQQEFRQIFPSPEKVEHNALEIWDSQLKVAKKVIADKNISAKQIAAIGITNQRETTVLWDRKTGKPVHNAIVWQDTRTADFCNELKAKGYSPIVHEKTGLLIDAYFSATKLKWVLDNVPNARKRAENGELAFGTIDTWLMWCLSCGKIHKTDVSNASRTLLFNIHTGSWDSDLLQLFDIPNSVLPKVCPSSSEFGTTSEFSGFPYSIPICGVAGDQQAALFGQMCTNVGDVKNTYGTGCFMMMNTGNEVVKSENNLLTTIAWQIGASPIQYALEGSVFIGGAVIQWLRDKLKIITSAKESEKLATSVESSEGVVFVPAFTGLGAPHWDSSAAGMIIGITRRTENAHIVRAALESIAFQTYDVLKSMEADANTTLKEMRVDGGATANSFLMQTQANTLSTTVIKSGIQETTALGAAYFAGLTVGFWKSIDEIKNLKLSDTVFYPEKATEATVNQLKIWHKAVERSKNWHLK